MKFSSATIRHPKRLALIIILALIVVAGATYAGFSYAYWRGYADRPQPDTALKSQIDAAFTPASTVNPADAIDQVVADFARDHGTAPCEINAWYRWQTVIPAIQALGTRCDESFNDSLSVTQSLQRLSAYLKDQHAAADALGAAVKATAPPKEYTATAKTWTDLATTAKTYDNEDFQPVSDMISSSATAISKAYAALAAANKKEDKKAFDSASSDLKKAYAGIAAIKTLAKNTQTTLVEIVLTDYQKL